MYLIKAVKDDPHEIEALLAFLKTFTRISGLKLSTGFEDPYDSVVGYLLRIIWKRLIVLILWNAMHT